MSNPWGESLVNCANGDNELRLAEYHELAEYIDGLLFKLARAEAGLVAARGYLVNASIDLQTGVKKSVALNTIKGGIKMIEAALPPPV